jgi:hypothetical protein
MKTHFRRWFFVVPWLVIAAAGLSAQEKPVLSDDIVQNFVKNQYTMSTAFSAIKDETGFLDFSDKLEEFVESLAAYLHGGEESFPTFKTAFIRVKNTREPGVEQVFSTLGLGQRGLEAFCVIILGMTIGLMENEIGSALAGVDPDDLSDMDFEELSGLVEIQDKLVMMRGLIHPDDMIVLDKNMAEFF